MKKRKPPKCKKGYNCGYSCISKNRKCSDDKKAETATMLEELSGAVKMEADFKTFLKEVGYQTQEEAKAKFESAISKAHEEYKKSATIVPVVKDLRENKVYFMGGKGDGWTLHNYGRDTGFFLEDEISNQDYNNLMESARRGFVDISLESRAASNDWSESLLKSNPVEDIEKWRKRYNAIYG